MSETPLADHLNKKFSETDLLPKHVAREAKVDESSVSRWRRGEGPGVAKLEAIARAIVKAETGAAPPERVEEERARLYRLYTEQKHATESNVEALVAVLRGRLDFPLPTVLRPLGGDLADTFQDRVVSVGDDSITIANVVRAVYEHDRPIVLHGELGSGKTWYAIRLCQVILDDDTDRIAIPVDAATLVEQWAAPADPVDVLPDAVIPKDVPNRGALVRTLNSEIELRRVVLVVDRVDEIDEELRKRLYARLLTVVPEPLQVVLACRTLHMLAEIADRDWIIWGLGPLPEPEALVDGLLSEPTSRALVKDWLRSPDVPEFLDKNPLALGIACRKAHDLARGIGAPDEVPATRTALIGYVVAQMIEESAGGRSAGDAAMTLLTDLARQTVVSSRWRDTIVPEDLSRVMTDPAQDQALWARLRDSGSIIEPAATGTGHKLPRFMHEYLVARSLSLKLMTGTADVSELIEPRVRVADWHQSIAFLAGLFDIQGQTDLLRELLAVLCQADRVDADDPDHLVRVRLMRRCVGEVTRDASLAAMHALADDEEVYREACRRVCR